MIYYIIKIVDVLGKVVKCKNKLMIKWIIFKKVVNMMILMMIGVFKYGIGKNVVLSGYMIVGKIGMINFGLMNDDNDCDKWIIGYIFDVVVVIWEGYDIIIKINQFYDVENNDIYGFFKIEMSGILFNIVGIKFIV